MSKGRWSKLLLMAALAPLLGASVLPTQTLALVCRFTGALMDEEACCPLTDQKQASPVSQLVDQGCCVVRSMDLPKLVSDRQVNGAGRCNAQPVLSEQTSEPLLPDAGGLPLHRVRPPPLGPPILLLKRSFLI